MLSRIQPDGRVCYKNFPCTDRTESCPDCPFAGTCRMLKEWEKNSENEKTTEEKT